MGTSRTRPQRSQRSFSQSLPRPFAAASAPPMSSSPRPAVGAPPPGSPDAAVLALPSEHQPIKEEGGAAKAAVQEEGKPELLWDDDSEEAIREHEEKINKYQAILAAHLKAKYFSNKNFDGGDVFEEVKIGSETIKCSRLPCTSSFANPAKFCQDKSSFERNSSPTMTADSFAKNDPSSQAAEASAKNNAASSQQKTL